MITIFSKNFKKEEGKDGSFDFLDFQRGEMENGHAWGRHTATY